MSAKTRIWVFHMKELIYTAVFVVLGIFFLLLLIFMFSPDQTAQTSEESPSPYTAGIYTTSRRWMLCQHRSARRSLWKIFLIQKTASTLLLCW